MDEHAWLAERFEEHRTRLRAVAYRMLGSLAEADEAESSLRACREFHRAASFLEGRPGLG